MTNEHLKYEFTDEHLKYEWDMLHCTHDVLNRGGLDQLTFNAFHESFWVHAHNLAQIWQYDDPVLQKVNDQILTLTTNRTAIQENKLQPSDREQFITNLYKHIPVKL